MLSTPEAAVGWGIIRFMNRLRMKHRLDQIFIDECHVIVNTLLAFRPIWPRRERLGLSSYVSRGGNIRERIAGLLFFSLLSPTMPSCI